MSLASAREWLLSQNNFATNSTKKNAKTIAITSGKGGVGKTSASIKISKLLAEKGYKVLLIDCDYNLSNTHLKLGLPVASHFYSLISAEKTFEECIHKNGNFHLLSGCNGNLELFENGLELERLVMDIISEHQSEYDYILLDSPAGIGKDNLALNAYCDERIVVVTPDKSSITDSYSLMKILSAKYGINENSLLVNKVSSEVQYKRMVKILSETVVNYLNGRLNVLGAVQKVDEAVDQFDGLLLRGEKSALEKQFLKISNKISEESVIEKMSHMDTRHLAGTKINSAIGQGVL